MKWKSVGINLYEGNCVVLLATPLDNEITGLRREY